MIQDYNREITNARRRIALPVEAEEELVDGKMMKTYKGYVPLVDDEGKFVGGLWAEVSAGANALLTREAPEILRN